MNADDATERTRRDGPDEAPDRDAERRPGGAVMAAGRTPDADRRRGSRRVAAAFAAFVGLSAGTTAYFSGGTAVEAALVAAVGLLVGVALVVVLGVR